MNLIFAVPIFSFVLMAVVVSVLDFKYRDIKTHRIWIPLVIVNAPVILYGYFTGEYPFAMFLVSLISSMVWYTYSYYKIVGGADSAWLSLISFFIVETPSGHLFFPTFLFFLVGFTAIALFWMRVWNRFKKTEIPIPYLAVISFAMLVALVVG